MAEPCTTAFGRYLRTLRERKGLSLDQVAALSQTFPETIHKGYLSRCENGHQKLAFAKLIPLSRIYETPADVLVERMELDMELDRVGGPDTDGQSYMQLTEHGKAAIEAGFRWNAYGYLREAVNRANVDPVNPNFRDRDEQIVIAHMSCGTAARSLGRFRFALHEYKYLHSTGKFGEKFYPVILERIASCHLELREYEAAEKHADNAIAGAESLKDREYLGYAYAIRGLIALSQSDAKSAIPYYQSAYEAFKNADRKAECVSMLNNLAQCYFDTGNYKAARRALEASSKLAETVENHRAHALSQILLGEIDEIEERPLRAVRRWKSAAEIAKKLQDKELRFKAEFQLLRRAKLDGNEPVARAIRRRLMKLSPWLTRRMEELDTFKEIESRGSS